MTGQTYTVRVPDSWAGVGSADVRAMLAGFLQHPAKLPPDPGPGDARLSLSLPARAVKVVAALLDESESGALRRVIAASRGELPPVRRHLKLLEAEETPETRALPVALPRLQNAEARALHQALGRSFDQSPEYRAAVETRIRQLEGVPPVQPSSCSRKQPMSRPVLAVLWSMNADLLTEDLKKKRASNQSFWLVGRPDVELRQIKKGEHEGKWQAEVHGFDYYNTRTGTIESGDTSKIAMWLLDTDYDGRSLYPRQVFFPMADEEGGWARLAGNLKAEIDPALIEHYRGTVSLPFEVGPHKRIAVKLIDDRGIESLKVVEVK